MTKPTPVAGGFFLVLPLIAGFIWGLGAGRAMEGTVIGFGVGLLLLIGIWLIDRRRQRPPSPGDRHDRP
jgi:hypothetical protein